MFAGTVFFNGVLVYDELTDTERVDIVEQWNRNEGDGAVISVGNIVE